MSAGTGWLSPELLRAGGGTMTVLTGRRITGLGETSTIIPVKKDRLRR